MNNSKKWCEVCKILIPYNRAAIKDHENSAKHLKNRQNHLIELNKQAKKKHKAEGKAYDQPIQKQKVEENVKWDHTEIVNHRETKEQQKQVADQLAFFGEGKIWILEKEDESQRLRFRNTITGQITYEKPVGLMLEDYEEEAWEEALQNPKQTMDPNLVVKIGQWEVVNQEDAFLNKYKAETDDEEISDDQEDEKKHQELQSKVDLGIVKNQMDFTKVLYQQFQEILMNGEMGNNRKQIFAQKLIQLAEQDIELRDALPQIQLSQTNNKINTQGLFKKKTIQK